MMRLWLPILLVFFVATSFLSCDPPDAPEASGPLKTDWPLSAKDAVEFQASEAKKLGVPVFSRLAIDKSTSIDLVFVPPGVFPMGNKLAELNPPRNVKISRGFLIGRYEVTRQQFLLLIDESEPGLAWLDRDIIKRMKAKNEELNYAAEINWLVISKFCQKLSSAQGVKARLVTEAEWEYACRAGTMALYGEWDSIDDTKANVLWWNRPDDKDGGDTSDFSAKKLSREVGRYKPNRWGIHDMLGNAEEWCLDDYTDGKDMGKLPRVDPGLNRSYSVFKSFRGGGYQARTVFERNGDARSNTSRGIRLVIEIDDAVKEKLRAFDAGGPR